MAALYFERNYLFCIGSKVINAEELNRLLKSDNKESKKTINEIFKNAITYMDYEIIAFLLLNQIKINVLNDSQQTALHLAVYNNFLDRADCLFQLCDNNVNYTDSHGLTHLHIACSVGNVQIVEQLLENGADIDVAFHSDPLIENKNFTPLHFAIANARTEVVELLLKRGADVRATDTLGRTPFHLACKISKRFANLVQRSYHKIKDRASNVLFDENDELLIMKLLLKYKSNVNARDQCGNTPLFHIFQIDYYNLAGYELSRFTRALPRVVIRELRSKQKEKLIVLVEHGVEINLSNNKGKTILHAAIEDAMSTRLSKDLSDAYFDDRVNAAMVEMLLKAGADVEARNENAETPLQLAVSVLSAEVVRVLLQHNADVNSVKLRYDENGRCFRYPNLLPFFEAVAKLINIVDLLRRYGLVLQPVSKLAVLKFFICNVTDFEYANSAGVYVKVINILDYGSAAHLQRLFQDIKTLALCCLIPFVCTRIKALEMGKYYVALEVREDVKRFSSEFNVDLMNQHCYASEIGLLNENALSNGKYLHDLLKMSPDRIYAFVKSKECKRILAADDFTTKFENYAGVIKGHFTKSLIRRYVLDSTKEFLLSLIGIRLPELCSEKICGFLTNEELWCLCLASTK